MKNKKKGIVLIIVFIICTVIAILVAATFVVSGNYNKAVFSRRDDLACKVNASNCVEDIND